MKLAAKCGLSSSVVVGWSISWGSVGRSVDRAVGQEVSWSGGRLGGLAVGRLVG